MKAGQTIAVRERSKSLEVIVNSVAAGTASKYSWLQLDPKALVGKYLNVPTRAEIPENINEQLIVDLYSK